MKILIACEESQAVCIAFRERGHEAYSCDLQDCSGGHPEWHFKGDCLPLLNGFCEFVTMGGGRNMTCPEYRKCMCFQCDNTSCCFWTDKIPDFEELEIVLKEQGEENEGYKKSTDEG